MLQGYHRLFLSLFLLVNLIFPACLCSGPLSTATFSIVAYDSLAGEWGVAVESKFLAVGAVVPWAKAGVGAIATQAWGNTTYGPQGLSLLQMGIPAQKVVGILTSQDPDREQRQLGVVDAQGQAAAWTGNGCMHWAGHLVGPGFSVQGNILAGKQVVEKMAESFRSSKGSLGRRLIAALQAGQVAGGDKRGRESAALLVVCKGGGYSGYNDRFIDLRVDDHPHPIEELERLYNLHEQTFQGGAYVRLGVKALQEGQREKANRALDRAISLTRKYPGNANLLNGIAWELAVNDFRLDDALELAEEATRLAPKDGNIWDTLGEVYARLGNYPAAIKAERKAISLSEGNKVFQGKLQKWQKMLQK